MLIVGELINSTRPAIREAVHARNAAAIIKAAHAQIDAGAHFIDINCAMTAGDEIQDIDWVISVIQSELGKVNICIDSPNYLAIERALKVFKSGGEVMINSITGESARIQKIVPLAVEHNAKVIALAMDETGMPDTAQARATIACRIVDEVAKRGFDPARLYVDPLIRPIATEPVQGREFLKSIPILKGMGTVKTICGLSNISFGLPHRALINSTFIAMALHAGLDAVILDPTDRRIASTIAATKAIMCDDEYCADYIRLFREGKLA